MSTRGNRSRRAGVALLLGLAGIGALGAFIDLTARTDATPAQITASPASVAAAGDAAPAGLSPAAATGDETTTSAPVSDARPGDAVQEIRELFTRGVELLAVGDHRRAAVVFHAVLVRAPDMPEAHVNLGFALLADGRAEAARIRFEAAIDRRPTQVNAYWGLAVALEASGDLRGALGAMRSYVHLAPAADPFVTRARSAVWEWQAALAARGTQARAAGGTP